MLEKVNTIKELAFFLSVRESELVSLNPERLYFSFKISKKHSNEKRLIEMPVGNLMKILGQIGYEIQQLYDQCKTDAAYGFIGSSSKCTDQRTILSNAKRHLGKKYLLNIDLDNFFHQIDIEKIDRIFHEARYFSFNAETRAVLSRIVSLKGRLPMGSPASPPLSNFATIDMDNHLLKWAVRHHFTYTRYVDDLSFSSNMPISSTHLADILEILQSHQFMADMEKIKWYGKNDIKIITGLQLTDSIDIPKTFFQNLDEEINLFGEIRDLSQKYPSKNAIEWIKELERVLSGKLSFIAMIYSRYHENFSIYAKKLKDIKPDFAISKRYNEFIGYDL